MNLENKIFEEFPGIATNLWEEVILKDLKGADYEKKLVWQTLEGFKVKPYYRADDLQNIEHLKHNNQFLSKRQTDNSWCINQNICIENVADANKKALNTLQRGATSIHFFVKENSLNTFQDFNALLKDIVLDAIEIHISGNEPEKYIDFLIQYIKENQLLANNIQGSVQFHVFQEIFETGIAQDNHLTSEIEILTKLLNKVNTELPGIRVISIQGKEIHNAGSTLVHEIAYSLSMASDLMSALLDKGLNLKQILPHFQVNLATGPNYFLEIAKIRALRYSWMQMCKAFGANEQEINELHIHSETATWNMTIYDAHVNLLRATTEAMSAIIGGCNSLTVHPYNAAYGTTDDLSDRLARNLQSILKDEAYLDKVNDAAAGSYYIEQLTASMIEASWKLFIETEDAGGFIQAFKKEIVQKNIEATAKIRNSNYATRKEIILGVNQYPNINEVRKEVSIPNLKQTETEGKTKGLGKYRGAQAYEEMRHKTDVQEKRPVAFLLTYGSVAMRRARAQFAQNFFGCAGFEVIDNNGFTSAAEGVELAKQKKADVIILCSADEEYEALAADTLKLLSGEILCIAGNPANKEQLEQMGVKYFIHVRSNVLETLLQFQQLLGIK